MSLLARTSGWRARRKALAEEQHWRAARPGRWRTGSWYPPTCQAPASLNAEAPRVVVESARLAALYRELRKGREDAKDEPGAADFYYGECEMRRIIARQPLARAGHPVAVLAGRRLRAAGPPAVTWLVAATVGWLLCCKLSASTAAIPASETH
jgi:hypothetical protein